METGKDTPSSGYMSPPEPRSPPTYHTLRRSDSDETLATSYSDAPSSTPSLNYPNPPLNTPATQSIASDAMSTAADFDVLTKQLKHASVSPPTQTPPNEGADDENDDEEDRSPTPTLQSFAAAAHRNKNSNGETVEAEADHTHEFSMWAPVAEEDTERALKRMAMLARDEHTVNPRFSVKEYYSMRLAKLIEAAEVEFDASHLH